MTAAAGTVALGALGQVKPTRLAQNFQAKRFFVVVAVDARPALLTASDAQVTAFALLKRDLAPELARWASAVVHHSRRPALGANLHVHVALFLNGRRGFPILVILGS